MYNPCYPFPLELIDALAADGFHFFVRQTFPRGADYQLPSCILSHYRDAYDAQRHFDIIATDTQRILFDINKGIDLQQLIAHINDPQQRVFTTLFSFDRWVPPKDIERKIWNFVKQQPGFRAGKLKINSLPFMHLGEVYLRITQGKEVMKIPLSEIENF